MGSHWGAGEIVVELANTAKKPRRGGERGEMYGPTNTQQHSKLFGADFRGRWSITGMRGASSAAGFMNMPDIPGIHIAVDLKKRRVRAVDPLAFPEHKETLNRANVIGKPFFGEMVPHPDSVIERATATELKTALWALRSWIDDGAAEIVHGELPKPEDILAMDGDLLVRETFLRTFGDGQGGYTTESPYATPEELEKMGKPPKERVTTVPAGTS